MICPKCGSGELSIVDTRPRRGIVRRRRRCIWCDHRFTTVELPYDTYKEDKRKMLERISSLAQELNARKKEEV